MVKKLFLLPLFITLLSCATEDQELSLPPPHQITTHFTIGTADQDMSYQLADPVGVRTDRLLNVYIADRGALSIRVYDRTGTYIRSIGRRGRGPAEFYDINAFDFTPKGNFFIMDRGRLQYKVITPEAKPVWQKTVKITPEWQFYPDQIAYDLYGNMIALFMDGGKESLSPILERKLFHIHDSRIDTLYTSFFAHNQQVDIELNRFTYVNYLARPGSFILDNEASRIFYSPRIYHGNIYVITKTDDSWQLESLLKGNTPNQNSYVEFDEQQYELYKANEIPGINLTYYGLGDPKNIGRINSIDAGIYELNDGRIISFVGEWRHPLEYEGEHEQLIDIKAQIFSEDGSVTPFKYVTSVKTRHIPWKPIVNWKDHTDTFYLINNSSTIAPTVQKFTIDDL